MNKYFTKNNNIYISKSKCLSCDKAVLDNGRIISADYVEMVLTDIDLDLIVTPSEIDFLIDKLSNLIASAINNSLHEEITHF